MFLSTHCAAPSAAVFQREAQGYPDHSQPPAADSCRCVHRSHICSHAETKSVLHLCGVSFWHEGNSYTPPCHPLQGCCRLQPSRARPQFPHSRYAGGNFIDSLQVAKMRDFYIDRLRRLHNRRSCRHLRKLSINRYSYHSPVLPPLKLPKPK